MHVPPSHPLGSKTMNALRRPRRFVLTAVALGLVLALPACSRDDAATFVESAKSYLAKSDPKAAIIQLRNARQAEPENAEIRFLLGRALLENGEPGPAETELRKADSLRYSADAVQPMLAQAGLITARRESRFIYYAPAFERMNELLGYLTENCCTQGTVCATACAPKNTSNRKRKTA